MIPPVIHIDPSTWKELQKQAEASYPFEGCGLLLGPFAKTRQATRIVMLRNILRDEGRGRFDFMFSAQEFMEKQRAAEAENLDIVGIFHTHPDHPPRPSATDASQPMLAGWTNVIASVHGGSFKEAKAWYREDEATPFAESELVVQSET